MSRRKCNFLFYRKDIRNRFIKNILGSRRERDEEDNEYRGLPLKVWGEGGKSFVTIITAHILVS